MKSSVEKQLIKALINSINRVTTVKNLSGTFSGISERDVLEILRTLGKSGAGNYLSVSTLDTQINKIISSHANLMDMYGFSTDYHGAPCYNGHMLAYEYKGEWRFE